MDALVSIFCAENQYRVIKSHHIHKSNMPYYCARYVGMKRICSSVPKA